jgi:hypothetical protein
MEYPLPKRQCTKAITNSNSNGNNNQNPNPNSNHPHHAAYAYPYDQNYPLHQSNYNNYNSNYNYHVKTEPRMVECRMENSREPAKMMDLRNCSDFGSLWDSLAIVFGIKKFSVLYHDHQGNIAELLDNQCENSLEFWKFFSGSVDALWIRKAKE